MLLAVETTLETLSDARRRNLSRDQLIEQFRRMADSVRRWYLPSEQQVGRRIAIPANSLSNARNCDVESLGGGCDETEPYLIGATNLQCDQPTGG